VKKDKKRINNPLKTSNPITQELAQGALRGNLNNKKMFFWVVAGLILVVGLVALGWFLGRHDSDDPQELMKNARFLSKREYEIKSSEISIRLTNNAVEKLKNKKLLEAIKDLETAISVFPLNAKAYCFLTEIYLKTGQEFKMYETLTLAGRSYPNFNSIVSVINDIDLNKMPLEEPQDNIFLANFPEDKKMAMTFLFDDGEKNIYDNAMPIFEKNGFRATIPVVAGMVAVKDDDPYWGSWNQWKDAANRGFEIANHSMYHRDTEKLHGSDLDIAIDQSKELIEKNIGRKITAYIFPYDSYNEEAVSRALKEHEVIRSWKFLRSYYNRTVGITYGGPYFSVEAANRLVDIGVLRHLWIVANCHGVTTKRGILSFKSITPSFLEEHLSYIHSKSHDVWVGTFTRIFEYLRLRSETKIEIKAFSDGSADFVLHADKLDKKLSDTLTVVLKTQEGAKVVAVHNTNGHKLWAWSCASDRLCVDVDAYEDNVHIEWTKIGEKSS